MAQTKKKQKSAALQAQLQDHLELTKKNRGIVAIVLFVLAILLILPAFGLGGDAGSLAFGALKSLAGIGYYLFPVLLISLATAFFREKEGYPTGKVIAGVLAFVAALGLVHLVREDGGGLLGSIIAFPFLYLFDLYATFLILAAVFIISILVLFELELSPDSFKFMQMPRLFSRGEKDDENLTITGGTEGDEEIDEGPEEPATDAPPTPDREKPLRIQERAKEDIGTDQSIKIRSSMSEYIAPPLTLLEKDRGKPGTGDIKANANIIRRTMQNFGIQV